MPVGRARQLAKGALTQESPPAPNAGSGGRLTGYSRERCLPASARTNTPFTRTDFTPGFSIFLKTIWSAGSTRSGELTRRLEDALDFQGSDRAHYRLRDRVCRLWGETFSDDGSDSLQAAENTIEILNGQLRAVRGLKQHGSSTESFPLRPSGGQVHRTTSSTMTPITGTCRRCGRGFAKGGRTTAPRPSRCCLRRPVSPIAIIRTSSAWSSAAPSTGMHRRMRTMVSGSSGQADRHWPGGMVSIDSWRLKAPLHSGWCPCSGSAIWTGAGRLVKTRSSARL